jgi:hypothetical protein
MTQPPRIVYAGPLMEWGSCLSRLRALQALEPNITVFDTQEYFFSPSSRSILQSLDEKLTFAGPVFKRANADFLSLCDSASPDIVWIDKSVWVWESTLKELRKRGVFLVHHNNDALYPSGWRISAHYRLLRRTLPYYDLYITTNAADWKARKDRDDPPTELSYMGYDSFRFENSPLSSELARQWASDILFVGHHEPSYELKILALADAGLAVRVYGPDWERAKERKRLAGVLQYKPLYMDDYVHALKGAKIGLSFFSELNYQQRAMRSFETAACGTFVLGMRSAQHAECFEEGVEAEFFGDTRELVDKARYYLASKNERKRLEIAKKGQERCVRSDYSWARYMRDDWAKTCARFAVFCENRLNATHVNHAKT